MYGYMESTSRLGAMEQMGQFRRVLDNVPGLRQSPTKVINSILGISHTSAHLEEEMENVRANAYRYARWCRWLTGQARLDLSAKRAIKEATARDSGFVEGAQIQGLKEAKSLLGSGRNDPVTHMVAAIFGTLAVGITGQAFVETLTPAPQGQQQGDRGSNRRRAAPDAKGKGKGKGKGGGRGTPSQGDAEPWRTIATRRFPSSWLRRRRLSHPRRGHHGCPECRWPHPLTVFEKKQRKKKPRKLELEKLHILSVAAPRMHFLPWSIWLLLACVLFAVRLFLSCFGGPTPSVLFLFLLVAVVGHGPLMLALLLAFVFWCPVCCCGASACFPWAVSVPCGGCGWSLFFGGGCGLWLMFIFWCFEASGRCLICFSGFGSAAPLLYFSSCWLWLAMVLSCLNALVCLHDPYQYPSFFFLVWSTWSWQGGLAMTLDLVYRGLFVDLPGCSYCCEPPQSTNRLKQWCNQAYVCIYLCLSIYLPN